MKIQAINNFHLNQINFESKKSNNTQSAGHTSAPLKAIPVALLMAMSPLNMQKATAQVYPVQLEQIQHNEDELVGLDSCSTATPDGNPGKVKMYMSRDGEEYIKLNLLKKTDAFAMNSKQETVSASKISTIDIRPEEFLIETTTYSGKGQRSKETKYYVVGSGIQYVSQIIDATTGEPLKRPYKDYILKIESQKFEITEEFYNLISKNPYNTVSTSKENKLVFSSGIK